MDKEAQDRADMERLAAGQESALNDLMMRHGGPLFRFLYGMLGQQEDAEDLAQEVFVRVYRYRDRFDGGTFTTWLYTIAANLARNEHRRRQRHPDVSLESFCREEDRNLGEPLPYPGAGPGEATQAREIDQAVRAAVNDLPGDLREALVLCEWQGLSAAEAAEVLQITARGVEARLYRARKLLRDPLKQWL